MYKDIKMGICCWVLQDRGYFNKKLLVTSCIENPMFQDLDYEAPEVCPNCGCEIELKVIVNEY